ncbi:DNA polymerase III subunit delta [Roseisolibacter sp. H3M3-2]|uniref:DNA polymerase III subunit delta n=1 Tax=Roseisolibacter sp. H3M3-2 TaxID=3031323 RepID=UPI0023DA0E99|nr:DNA polymerase III subunit delta [Roseisolibacter sp. H3M3-2]MDF1502764.1 DNA polymerase III subunit delta [Roseisolibacter sp. H3M3-2]
MSTAHKTLNAAFKTKAFAAAYYFHGEDDYLKEDAVRQLMAAAVDPATRDFNCEVRRGGELDAQTLDGLLATPPMMAERRLVAVRDVGALKKDARAALDRYLQRPAPDTVLLLLSPAGAKADAKLAGAADAYEFAPLNEERTARWIAHHAQAELGATVTPEAVRLLVGGVGTELQQLAAELDKVVSYARGERDAAGGGGGEIVVDEAAVTAVVGVRRGETLGDLLDAVARQDARTAAALVGHVLAQPKASAVTTVFALSTQMLAIAWGQARRAQGASPGALNGEFFNLLKEAGGAYVGRPWGEAVKAWVAAVDRWTAPALDRALTLLLEADASLKDTRVSSDEQVVDTLVLALCALPNDRGRRAA